jgi:hypothetical protein
VPRLAVQHSKKSVLRQLQPRIDVASIVWAWKCAAAAAARLGIAAGTGPSGSRPFAKGLVVLNDRNFVLNATQDVGTCLRIELMGEGQVQMLGRAPSPAGIKSTGDPGRQACTAVRTWM